MTEIEIKIIDLAKICNFNVGIFRQYCGHYELAKYVKRKCKPMTLILNDESIKAFQKYFTLLDKGCFISTNNRLHRFNKGIKRIKMNINKKALIVGVLRGEWVYEFRRTSRN